MSKIWKDEKGLEIPSNRITKSEKLRERRAEQLLKEANKLNDLLNKFKLNVTEICEEVYKAVLEENNVNPDERKGNFTWYNFDRSIKVEVAINERIEFDDALIAAAKVKFDEFLDSAANAVEEMIRSLIMDAFSTSRGKLDSKKVLGLIRHRSRVPSDKYPNFHEAIDLIERSIRRPESKTYFRIWEKDAEGKYQNVDLNFSSI